MRFKKVLSVFLAVVMAFSAASVGVTAVAAEIDYDAQYRLLANALKNEYVRELTNYTVTSTKLDNGTKGYNAEVKGFAYDHRVTAADNTNGDILKASNRFYYIAEALMSYTYGVGNYDAKTLIEYVSAKLKPYFDSANETVYEDFNGERYVPSEEEIAAYNNAVASIEAAGGEVNQGTLTEAGLFFMERNLWEYYNVETVLKYFAGNVTAINTSNWYHRFSFVVETSVETCLQDFGGLQNVTDTILTIRTAVYHFEYQRFYNETASKAFFAFKQTSLKSVWDNYGKEFELDMTSADLTQNSGNMPGLLRDGQAANYLIKVTSDDTTVPELLKIESDFDRYVTIAYNEGSNTKWDSVFVNWDDNKIKGDPYAQTILGHAKTLTEKYSNDTLLSLFGNKIGNMVTLAYLFKTMDSPPTRVVRNGVEYEASPEKINNVIYSLDNLVSSENDGEEASIANKVADLISLFLDVGGLLGAEGIEYDSLEDLIGKILQSLVFQDSIVNMLVELVYPMLTDLLEDLLGDLTGSGVIDGWIGDILDDVIKDNDLAIRPNDLGNRIENDYPDGRYDEAASVLQNAADNSWENVNFEGVSWGIAEADDDKKADAFLDALCAGLSGFTRLLVCVFLGDWEYRDKDVVGADNFGNYYDLTLIKALSVKIASQGLYTKLFVPLYRVFGLTENEEYLNSGDYHTVVAANMNLCLKEAVRPIITWVTDHVAKKPFQSIMKLVPNLVYFLSRQGSGLSEYSGDWAKPSFVVDLIGYSEQEEAHMGFSTLQTYNLWTILENVHINIIGLVGARLWGDSITGLIGDSTGAMLTSLNALLNEVIGLTYETDIVASANIVCYTDSEGNFYFPDSEDFVLKDEYEPHLVYYSNDDHTSFSLVKDAAHPVEHADRTYSEKPFYLPSIPEAKLFSSGDVNPTTNTIDVKNPGQVFLFLLRYVLSAVGYRYDVNSDVPTLIECLGLDLEDELFAGLTLGDIIYNVMLHPDEAICALLELFTPNETGDLYEKKPYTYPLENINYYEDVLLNKGINPTLTYGTEVKYSQYWTKEVADDFIENLTPLAETVVSMLGLEGAEDGIGPFLENLLNENVFNDDLVNTLFNTIYQLIATLNDMVGMDLEGILDSVLGVSFAPAKVANTLTAMAGESEAAKTIAEIGSWLELFTVGTEFDPETGEEVPVLGDVELVWGINEAENSADAFLRTVSALLSPAAFLLKFLFMDQDLDILGLVHLPGYAGYQYAFIGLLEALSCPNILTYDQYYEASQQEVIGDANVIYYLFAPLLGLIENVYADPLNTVLSLIPNLLFFISIGGFNDLVNNLVHFAYVLIDILKPILNAYDLLDGLIANIEISGFSLNLSLPLDLNFNSLISELLGSLVGDALTIEGVSLTLPHIDLYTLCVGTLERVSSKENRMIAHLNASGGGELLTALLRIVFEVLFMEENHEALSKIVSNLIGEGILDAYDEETLFIVINGLIGLIEEYEALDIVLYAVYLLLTNVAPIADVLAERLAANNMTITEFFGSMTDFDSFISNIMLIIKDPNEVEVPGQTDDMGALGSLFAKIKAFFEKLKLFFQRLFNFG